MGRSVIQSLLALVCLVAPVAHFAGDAEAAAQAHADQTIEVAETIGLLDLLQLLAEADETPLFWSEVSSRAERPVRIPAHSTREDLYAFAHTALASSGLQVIQLRTSDALHLVAADRAPQEARLLPSLDGVPELVSFVRVMPRAHGVLTPDDAKAFEAVLGPRGSIIVGDTERPTVVAGEISKVREALQLLARVRLARAAAQPRLLRFEPKYVVATTLATRAATVVSESPSVAPPGRIVVGPGDHAVTILAPECHHEAWEAFLSTLDRASPITRRSYAISAPDLQGIADSLTRTIRQEKPIGSGEDWQVTPNPVLGLLTVSATPSEHAEIEAFLQAVQAAPAAAAEEVRAIPVVHRDVGDVLDMVTAIVGTDAGAPLPAGSRSTPERAAGGLVDSESDGSAFSIESVSVEQAAAAVIADAATNSLLVRGTPQRIREIEILVRSLDRRQTQVLVQATLVSLSQSDALDFGVELAKSEVSGSVLFELATLFGFGLSGTSESPEPGIGFSGVALGPGDFAIVLRALQVINEGESVTAPRALVDNNATATLDSVTQQPVASINASSTVATTSFSSYEDAGTSIRVTPRITAGDQLSLEYSINLGAFVGTSSDPSLPPPRQRNTLASSVTIPDGYTIVLGGLDVSTDGQGVSSIPLLGDIPLLGELFKSTSKTSNRARFFVFLRADILRDESFEDLKHLSDQSTGGLGLRPDWPRAEPRVIR